MVTSVGISSIKSIFTLLFNHTALQDLTSHVLRNVPKLEDILAQSFLREAPSTFSLDNAQSIRLKSLFCTSLFLTSSQALSQLVKLIKLSSLSLSLNVVGSKERNCLVAEGIDFLEHPFLQYHVKLHWPQNGTFCVRSSPTFLCPQMLIPALTRLLKL